MSMGDWAEGRPDQKPHLDRLWDLILITPWLDWLMLTKRPQLINKLCPLRSQRIWQGTTTENQYWLDLRWEHLKRVDSEIYWFSAEPLFEPLKLPTDFLRLGARAQVICGAQSGAHARHMDPDWARDLLRQCRDSGVKFHLKQLCDHRGHAIPFEQIPEDLQVREYPTPVPEMNAHV
jgi:protein gp37